MALSLSTGPCAAPNPSLVDPGIDCRCGRIPVGIPGMMTTGLTIPAWFQPGKPGSAHSPVPPQGVTKSLACMPQEGGPCFKPTPCERRVYASRPWSSSNDANWLLMPPKAPKTAQSGCRRCHDHRTPEVRAQRVPSRLGRCRGIWYPDYEPDECRPAISSTADS